MRRLLKKTSGLITFYLFILKDDSFTEEKKERAAIKLIALLPVGKICINKKIYGDVGNRIWNEKEIRNYKSVLTGSHFN